MLVHFYLVRHGEHDGTNLTPDGVEQVRTKAEKHLWGIDFDHAFSSGLPRAHQTAEVSLAASQSHRPDSIQAEEGFGYMYAEEQTKDEWPWEKFLERVKEEQAAGRPVMLSFTLKQWPPAKIIRSVLHFTMRHWAERIFDEQRAMAVAGQHAIRDPQHVLVGTHASAVCAALQPDAITGYPDNGDIVRYTWRIENERARLIDCCHLS